MFHLTGKYILLNNFHNLMFLHIHLKLFHMFLIIQNKLLEHKVLLCMFHLSHNCIRLNMFHNLYFHCKHFVFHNYILKEEQVSVQPVPNTKSRCTIHIHLNNFHKQQPLRKLFVFHTDKPKKNKYLYK